MNKNQRRHSVPFADTKDARSFQWSGSEGFGCLTILGYVSAAAEARALLGGAEARKLRVCVSAETEESLSTNMSQVGRALLSVNGVPLGGRPRDTVMARMRQSQPATPAAHDRRLLCVLRVRARARACVCVCVCVCVSLSLVYARAKGESLRHALELALL